MILFVSPSDRRDPVVTPASPMPNPAAASRSALETLGLTPRALGLHELPLGALVWLSFGPVAGELARSAALAKELQIVETGEVPRLRVRNHATVDVLLPCDLVFDGGKQARVVERSVIIPATGEVDVPVRCVEAGRWAPKAGASASTFSFKTSAATHSREHLMALKQAMLKKHHTYELEQREVWSHVAAELTRTGTASWHEGGLVRARRRRRAGLRAALLVEARPPHLDRGLRRSRASASRAADSRAPARPTCAAALHALARYYETRSKG